MRQVTKSRPRNGKTNTLFGTRVQDGKYELMFLYHETGMYFGGAPKLTLWFKLIEPVEDFGLIVPRHYNIIQTRGRIGRNGKFVAGQRSDVVREVGRLCDIDIDPRRMDFEPLRHYYILGEIKTVTIGYDRKEIPERQRYSVITELLAVQLK